jgi:alkylation response protein AidB-like acyl-CoA dehydrogenase
MTAAADLLYDETDEELRGNLRGMLSERSPWSKVLARIESPETCDSKLWAVLAGEMGLAGLAVPEELGGAGATWRQVAVVLEELGRAVAPVPYLGSAVIATRALLHCGERDLLAELASGRQCAALAVPFSAIAGAVTPSVSADGDALTGTVTSVADALIADVLLVPTADALYAVSAADATRTSVVSLDMTRQLCDVAFDGARARRIASGPAAVSAVTAALTTGAALLASEQVGLAQWCLDTTVEYLKTRYQFGRQVGSFQALKHRLADLWTRITQARAVARYAAARAADAAVPGASVDAERSVDAQQEEAIAAALAQAYCSDAAVLAAEECVQLHGGIGFTWEHPAHLYLKRAKSSAIALGTPDRQRAALARMVDVPAA